MTFEETEAVKNNAPILLSDGNLALIIRFPSLNGNQEFGVQVPGEDNLRWINIARVVDKGNNALIEIA